MFWDILEQDAQVEEYEAVLWRFTVESLTLSHLVISCDFQLTPTSFGWKP